MPVRFPPFARLLGRYPLTDRVTFSFDAPAAVFAGLFNGLAVTFTGIIGRKLGMDAFQLALMSMSGFLGLLLNLWIGHASETGDKRAWVFWPGALGRGVVALAGVWANPVLFLSVMCVYNIVSTFSGPAYSSIMRSNYSDPHRGEIMGYIRILIQLASAAAAGLAGAFMDSGTLGYQILMPVAAAFGVASSCLFRRVKVRKLAHPADRSEESASFRDALSALSRDRTFLIYMAIYFVIGFPDKLVISLEPIRFVDELGMTYAMAGLVQGTIPLLAAMFGYFLMAKLAKRFDPVVLLAVATVFSSARFLNTAVAHGSFDLIPGSFLNGVAMAGWDLLPLFSIILFASHDKVSFYMGFHSMLVGIRGLGGPVIGSWLYEGLHLPIVSVYWIAFGIEIGGALLLVWFVLGSSRRALARDEV